MLIVKIILSIILAIVGLVTLLFMAQHFNWYESEAGFEEPFPFLGFAITTVLIVLIIIL